MANEIDYPQQWRNYLSYGYRGFSEQLLTPDIALIVSPDGSKIIVIGDDTKNLRYKYDEQKQVVYFGFCNGGSGTRLNCPACGRPYIISFEDYKRVGDGPIPILKGTRSFDCPCGVLFVFSDRYKFLHLPFELVELAPLYLAGMSRNADLFVRYTLNSDSHILVEEVGVISQMPNAISLTENPSFKFFNWCNRPGPSFVLESCGGSFFAYDVQIWRMRTYTLGSDMFEEKIRSSALDGGWQRVFREVRSVPDNYANRKMVEALAVANKTKLSSKALLQSVVENKLRGRPKVWDAEILDQVMNDAANRISKPNLIRLDLLAQKINEHNLWKNPVTGDGLRKLVNRLLKTSWSTYKKNLISGHNSHRIMSGKSFN